MTMRRRKKVFPVNPQQKVEHVGVKHIPWSNLLLDHVETGFFDVSEHWVHKEALRKPSV
jgi:hypothetical protein